MRRDSVAPAAPAVSQGSGGLPLLAHYRPDAPLIRDADGVCVRHRHFLLAARRWAAALPTEATHLVPLVEGRGNFMLVLAAGLLTGKPLLLPPAATPAALTALASAHPQAVAVRDDDPEAVAASPVPAAAAVGFAATLRLPPGLAAFAEAIADRSNGQLREESGGFVVPADRIAVIAHTSGSTGTPRPEPKRWDALVAVAEQAAERFLAGPPAATADAARATIVATVPPQHMWGLEASVMMALAAGCAVADRRPFFPADVAAALRAVPTPRVLVTTPVHLRACVAAPPAASGWPATALLLSATAPLGIALAEAAETAFAAPVHEVYGCTEAGSLAGRRTVAGAEWWLYPRLRLEWRAAEADGGTADAADDASAGDEAVPEAEADVARPLAAFIHAPYLPAPVRLADRLEPADDGAPDRFVLAGRDGELLKVGGKRMALAALTQALLALPGVEDAVVFLPEPPADLGDAHVGVREPRVHAQPVERRPAALVVAPTRGSAALLAELARVVDAVFLPRPLRCVERLPRNAVGKLPRAAVLALFERRHATR